MIIFYSVAGLIFILDLFFRFTKPESRLYRTKLVAFYLIAIAYIFALSYDSYKFYLAQNTISSGIDKDFLLEIQNNSNKDLDLKFLSIKEKEEKYKRYYINKINIYDPKHLLQNIIIKSGKKSSFNLKLPYSAFILIQDNISGKSIKIYRTDIKMRLYASDFKEIDDIVKVDIWYEISLIGANFAFLFVIIFLFKQLPRKIIKKIILLIPLLIFLIISSYNLYILVLLLGVI